MVVFQQLQRKTDGRNSSCVSFQHQVFLGYKQLWGMEVSSIFLSITISQCTIRQALSGTIKPPEASEAPRAY